MRLSVFAIKMNGLCEKRENNVTSKTGNYTVSNSIKFQYIMDDLQYISLLTLRFED